MTQAMRAALFCVAAAILMVTPARAEVRFNFGLGIGPEPDFCQGPFDRSNCWDPPFMALPGFYPRGFYYPYPYPYPPRSARISCDQGVRMLARAGYRAIRPMDCRGDTYRFLALRKGRTVEVRLWSRTGRIYQVTPLR